METIHVTQILLTLFQMIPRTTMQVINYKSSIRMFEKGTAKDENKKLAALCAYFN